MYMYFILSALPPSDIYACKMGDVTFEKRGDLASVFFVNVLAKVKDIHVHVDQA